jgi:hypothetical protein
VAVWLFVFAFTSCRNHMSKHLTIVAEVDKAVIERCGFPNVQVSTVSETIHEVRTQPDGEQIVKEAPIGCEQQTKECVFRDGNRMLRIRLKLEEGTLKTVNLAATPDAKEAASLWAELIRKRNPGIEILITGELPQ